MNRRLDTKNHVYTGFGILLLCVGLAGQIFSLPTLGISLVLGLLCLLVGFFKRRPFYLQLIDVWILAYLYLYLSDYVVLRSTRLLPFGDYISNLTEGFIVASFGGSLLGYGLLVHHLVTRWAFSSPRSSQLDLDKEPKVPSNDVCAQSTPTCSNHRTALIASRRRSAPVSVAVLVVVLSVIVVFYILQVMTLEQLLFVARAEQSPEIEVGSLSSFMSAATVVFPILTVFLLQRYKFPLPLVVWMFSCCLLAFVAVFARGSRFPLGFQIVGVVFFWTEGFRLNFRRMLGALLVAALVLSSAAVMRETRSMGIGNASFALVNEILSEPENYLSPEGVLFINALIHHGHAYPLGGGVPDNLFLLYWWVPRTWWPEKPVMAGYWVIRELSSEKVSTNHSVSGGFGMPALIDFGPIAGAFFCIVYGTWLAAFEAYVRRHRDLRHPGAILAGLLYFGVFFMMRSLQTSLIFIMTASLVSVVPLALLERLAGPRYKRIGVGSARRVPALNQQRGARS